MAGHARAAPAARARPASLALALIIGASGLAILGTNLSAIVTIDRAALAVMIALVLIARTETLPVFDRSSFAVSVVPVLAAAMVLGVPGAAAVALVSGLANAAVRHLPWYKALFNCGNYVIAGTIGALVFHAAGVPLQPDRLPLLLPLGVVTGLAHYLHTVPLALAIASEHGTRPDHAWREHCAWQWPYYGALGILSTLLALAYHQFGPWGAAAFLVPPAMMLYSAKQYVDRTSESVRKLRDLNDELLAEMAQRATTETENTRLAHEAARAAVLQETNEAKSRFISIVSHEMRTPLTSVLGYTEIALADTPADDPRRPMLETAYAGAQRLGNLVDDLLDASRIELGTLIVRPVELDLAATVTEAVRAFANRSARHRLVTDVAPETSRISADPARLRQMLAILLDNAIKYSPSGGEVRVSIRPAGPDAVTIAVADEGVGIQTSEVERIFDPYQRIAANRKIQGTGLGLYIARHLAELHGGRLVVEARPASGPARGSTFVLTLPIGEPEG
jgi:signal transduction histidine kinase